MFYFQHQITFAEPKLNLFLVKLPAEEEDARPYWYRFSLRWLGAVYVLVVACLLIAEMVRDFEAVGARECRRKRNRLYDQLFEGLPASGIARYCAPQN